MASPTPGKVSVGYFTNWGIYGRKYPPSLIPAENLSHILYAFANLRGETGEVFLSDEWADKDIHYPGDSWNDEGNNLYGNFKQLYLLKKKHRHLKLLLSIDGWSYSSQFHPIVVSPAKRTRFVQSAVRLLEDYGLDGLDIDYEYPDTPDQAKGYVELLRDLREALDHHARTHAVGYKYQLTIAAPCGPSNYEKLHLAEMDQYLSYVMLMAYDYAGSWDSVAGHQANVHGGILNTEEAVEFYIKAGVHPSKLVIGIPLYGRSFMNTTGPGQKYSGVGPGSWEKGVYDYRALPLPNAYLHRDESLIASWSIDYQKKEMVTFDDEAVGEWKGKWIKQRGLAGSMFWELSGDKGTIRKDMEGGPGKDEQPGRSLVAVVKSAMGNIIDDTPNWLTYRGSKFDNLRNDMKHQATHPLHT